MVALVHPVDIIRLKTLMSLRSLYYCLWNV